jgi:hypothetical protein
MTAHPRQFCLFQAKAMLLLAAWCGQPAAIVPQLHGNEEQSSYGILRGSGRRSFGQQTILEAAPQRHSDAVKARKRKAFILIRSEDRHLSMRTQDSLLWCSLLTMNHIGAWKRFLAFWLTLSSFKLLASAAPVADPVDQLAATALNNVYKILDGSLSDNATHTKCTKSKLLVRKEYGDLTVAERTNYVNAVKCLQSKPSKLSASVAPGAKSRFDDFVAVHLNQTLTIHLTVRPAKHCISTRTDQIGQLSHLAQVLHMGV